ncbi:hypothetical protein AALP_AA6G054000 [Arabis alpina]|uniref:RRM domain-containing protein n=1 Tax=Arabis alpina TaxID=50452 RepID=A0A087GM85_ARAAL|nr:hypothetical protein AALP_AA6G054000 [Arabis alpina]
MEMEGKWLKKCSTSTTTTDAVKKIQKKKKENKKLKKCFKQVPVKKKLSKETSVKQVEPVKRMSICVNGLDASLSKDDIKTALRNHFGSCGVVEDIFVPTVFETGATRGGCAHIDMRAGDEDKALTLDGSFLGGRRLHVRIATFGQPINSSCKTCPLVIMEGKMERFLDCSLTWKFERAIKYGCTLEDAMLKKWDNQ